MKPPIEDRFSAVKQLIELGRSKGYLLYDEIQDLLPTENACHFRDSGGAGTSR